MQDPAPDDGANGSPDSPYGVDGSAGFGADETWRQIVAALQAEGPATALSSRPWPAAEDLPPSEPDRVDPTGVGPAGEPPAPHAALPGPTAHPDPGPANAAGSGHPDSPGPAEEDEEHFVPPAPPPVPRPTGTAAYGTAALICGFLVLAVPTMAGDPVGPAMLVLAVAAIVGGFGLLVARMRPGPPTDSDPDDGAVV